MWEQPITRDTPPIERESHTCISYRGQLENRTKLIIYGGMNGQRLGDLWNFYLGKKPIRLIKNSNLYSV